MRISKDPKYLVETNTIDFGIVEVGTTKEVTLYLHNDSDAVIRNLKYAIGNKKVELVNPPERIVPRGVEALRFRWSPTLLKQPLKTTIEITGEEIYG